MYHSESGVGVFNRRHLFLTSLPCLSLLPALKLPLPHEQLTVDSNGLKNRCGFLSINIKYITELSNVFKKTIIIY